MSEVEETASGLLVVTSNEESAQMPDDNMQGFTEAVQGMDDRDILVSLMLAYQEQRDLLLQLHRRLDGYERDVKLLTDNEFLSQKLKDVVGDFMASIPDDSPLKMITGILS